MMDSATARILGTILGAIIGGVGGGLCSQIVDISLFMRIICVLVILSLVLVSYWLCSIIPYFRNNNYAATILLVTTVSVCLS